MLSKSSCRRQKIVFSKCKISSFTSWRRSMRLALLALCLVWLPSVAAKNGQATLGESIAAELQRTSPEAASLTPATIGLIDGMVQKYVARQASISVPAKAAMAWRGNPGGSMEWPRGGAAWNTSYPNSIPEPTGSPPPAKPDQLKGSPEDYASQTFKNTPGRTSVLPQWRRRKKKFIDYKGNLNFCDTQISVKVCRQKGPRCWRRDLHTCTSCKPGSGLLIKYPHQNAGSCSEYNTTAKAKHGLANTQVNCARYDDTARSPKLPMWPRTKYADLMEPNMICTKIGQETEEVRLKGIMRSSPRGNSKQAKDTRKAKRKALKYFLDFTRKKFPKFKKKKMDRYRIRATCNVWKQTVCTAAAGTEPTECQTKKEVKCVRVCQVISDRWSWDAKTSLGECSEEMCRGDFGYLACLSAATMA